MQIHIAIITHRHGTNLETALNKADIYAKVAAFCRTWAASEEVTLSDADNDETTVSEYFEQMDGRESVLFSEAENPASPLTTAFKQLLQEALAYEAKAFEEDDDVNGADLVDFFTEWRAKAKSALHNNNDLPGSTSSSRNQTQQ